jgi:hypothetical protein
VPKTARTGTTNALLKESATSAIAIILNSFFFILSKFAFNKQKQD